MAVRDGPDAAAGGRLSCGSGSVMIVGLRDSEFSMAKA